jgi:enoyl-CoA hydratase/carnithine racemase
VDGVSDDEIGYERRGAGAWIRLNRPSVLNSLTPTMVDALGAALDAAEADGDVKAVVITGNGRGFCVGTDLGVALGGGDQFDLGAYLGRLGGVLRRIELFGKPVIAAVNGVAVAGGLELLLACDLVVAAESASIGDGHANYGLVPGGGGSVRLPQRVGATRAKYLLYTGALVPAATLRDWGAINDVVPADALEATVDSLVETLAAKSPLGIRRMKELVASAADLDHEDALTHELDVVVAHVDSYDYPEGLSAFVEKRTPQFLGR